jgi:hypothetical protein
MRQQTAGQRSRRQTVPSRPPLELIGKDTDEAEEVPDGLDSIADIQNELDFTEWYNDLEDNLLETSYDEYQ